MDLKKIIILAGVGLASAAVGILLPTVISGGGGGHGAEAAAHADPAPAPDPHAADKEKTDHEPKKDAGAHGHGEPAKDEGKAKPKEGPQFLQFCHLVINLNEPMLIKYLTIEVCVQTDAKYEAEVKAALEANKPILTTWLTGHLADKTVEDIRGKVGINRLRREIQDNFNSMLFKDGHERVQDIMFDEFHVQ